MCQYTGCYMENRKITKPKEVENISYNVLEELELERRRIARELHDSTIQMLTMLIYKAEYCENVMEKDAIRTKMELQIMKQVLKESINEIRNTIFNLHPMSIEDLGLVASLQRLLIFFNRNSNIDFTLKVDGAEQECQPIINISVYRIVQESCNNIVKHSKATRASIHVTYTEQEIYLEVQDDGMGITDDKLNYDTNFQAYCKEELFLEKNMSGYGIPMMRERVNLLEGNLDIDTSGRGTLIRVSIPLCANKEDMNGID